MGGMIVRVFAHRYPKETAGMVLVDPADENLDDRLHAKMNQQQWDSYSAGLKEHFADPMMKPEALAMESHSEASAAVPQPKVPIIVLSGTQPNARWPNSDLLRTSMTELHTEWVHKTPGAELILVRGAGHYIQIDAPETVITAIEKVMTETKH
jgi:pimeloyl-ACP methyl ester carboxylesterase